jgi:hypothetical protein
MNDQQIAFAQQAHTSWIDAEKQTDVRRAYALYQKADGLFIAAMKSGTADATLQGKYARFCYFYCGFHAQRRKDYREAEKTFKIGNQYADKALALDPNDFDAHFSRVLNALDQLGNKPNLSSALFDEKQGGLLERFVKTGFDHSRFNTAKTNFFKALAALLDAYAAKTHRDAFIEDVLSMSEDLLLIVDACMDYSFDLSNVFETIQAVDEENLTYYSDEEELDNLLKSYLDLKTTVSSRLIAIQQR